MYCLQAQCAITYLVRVLRWDDIVANDIITALNAIQMLSGFETPLLEDPTVDIAYKGTGWILNLRAMLREYDMSLSIEHVRVPQRQRLYDRAILEEMAKAGGLTPKEQLLAAEFRLWLRVTMVSELANEIGTEIESYKIENDSEWRAESTLRWPNHIEPTNAHRAAFRKGLRESICTTMSPYATRQDYKLDTPLGKWYPVRRDTLYTAYRDKDTVYYRDETGLHKGIPRGPYKYKIPLDTVEAPPLKSHPIPVNFIGPNMFWTKRPRRMARRPRLRQHKVVVSDTLPADATEIDLVSDAAVHVAQEKGAVCWRAVNEEEQMYSQRFPVEFEKDSYSYRQELIGLYHALRTVIKKFPKLEQIRCHCDNKAGIDKVKQPTYGPGEVSGPDMDVILAIREIVKKEEELMISFHHVMGHADEKKEEEDITRIEHHNIGCDDGAELSVDDTPRPFHPLKGSKCMLRIRGRWITTRVDKAIQDRKGEYDIKKYLLTRLAITEEALEDIDTAAIEAARSVHTLGRTVRTSKMMVRWLPIGAHCHHHGAHNSYCPGCGEPGETFEHLFTCPNADLMKLRQLARLKVRRML
eukprot:scaffold30735_cov52-Cyclotella_meneghiniana.AAC.7